MAKQNFRELEMDPMERLFYERKDRRKKAYAAKRRKTSSGNRRISMKKQQIDKVGEIAFTSTPCGII